MYSIACYLVFLNYISFFDRVTPIRHDLRNVKLEVDYDTYMKRPTFDEAESLFYKEEAL